MQSEWNDGILECWPPARSAYGLERILGVRAEITHFNCKKTPSKPSFHYSNWGEAPKFVPYV